MEWLINQVTKHEGYEVVEIKCPVCGFKETLTRYKYEDKERECYLCEETRTLPELGEDLRVKESKS